MRKNTDIYVRYGVGLSAKGYPIVVGALEEREMNKDE
jgi:hypothetical protein